MLMLFSAVNNPPTDVFFLEIQLESLPSFSFSNQIVSQFKTLTKLLFFGPGSAKLNQSVCC